jgi:hypothetical protein
VTEKCVDLAASEKEKSAAPFPPYKINCVVCAHKRFIAFEWSDNHYLIGNGVMWLSICHRKGNGKWKMEENRQIWSRIVVCNNTDLKTGFYESTSIVVLHRQILYGFKTGFHNENFHSLIAFETKLMGTKHAFGGRGRGDNIWT